MQASGEGRDGAMAAVIGLDDARLPELVKRSAAYGVSGVANRNAPGQVVVSGERAIGGRRRDRSGARSPEGHRAPGLGRGPLPLMGEAAKGDAGVLETAFNDPIVPLIANADAARSRPPRSPGTSSSST
jgi:[acyl-carrier-protein] S-malonyltransferase